MFYGMWSTLDLSNIDRYSRTDAVNGHRLCVFEYSLTYICQWSEILILLALALIVLLS